MQLKSTAGLTRFFHRTKRKKRKGYSCFTKNRGGMYLSAPDSLREGEENAHLHKERHYAMEKRAWSLKDVPESDAALCGML